ncbi:hypothetical protein [Nonomuraea roseola]
MEDQLGKLSLCAERVHLVDRPLSGCLPSAITRAGFPVTDEMCARLSPIQ